MSIKLVGLVLALTVVFLQAVSTQAAGFAPAGRQTTFHGGIVSSIPIDPHCLVALIFLYLPTVVSPPPG